MCDYTATYSPDDNKLRLYATARLDEATYNRVKAAGFKWAPHQGLFVAPMWTPWREDLLRELAGDIDDEDTSLMERAEDRAERFDDYQDSRRHEAERAREAVDEISQAFANGQPILVGHHSEKRARRDQERMHNGMRKALRLWDTADYWQRRATNALAHAEYKERADVRARRIRRIEADQRKQARSKAEAEKFIRAWSIEGITRAQALMVANLGYLSASFPVAKYPRKEGASTYEGPMSVWSALNDEIITAEQAQGLALPAFRRQLANAERWLTHYANRLTYERAMLGEQGGTVADRTEPEKGGAVRCWASPGHGQGWAYIVRVNKITVTILDNWGNGGRNFRRTIKLDDLKGVMTAAGVAEARTAGRLVEAEDGTGFYLAEPTPDTTDTAEQATAQAQPEAASDTADSKAAMEAMRAQLRAGVQVIVAPQLFPTPPDVAEHMAELAEIEDGMTVLEPNAGTGVLLDAVRQAAPNASVKAVEVNARLVEHLRERGADVQAADFLACGDELGRFDRIVMNPPFANAADIAHILHARSMLKPGGRLVALCANGPRQADRLRPLATSWEDLPQGTFKHAGTNVNTALLVIEHTGE